MRGTSCSRMPPCRAGNGIEVRRPVTSAESGQRRPEEGRDARDVGRSARGIMTSVVLRMAQSAARR